MSHTQRCSNAKSLPSKCKCSCKGKFHNGIVVNKTEVNFKESKTLRIIYEEDEKKQNLLSNHKLSYPKQKNLNNIILHIQQQIKLQQNILLNAMIHPLIITFPIMGLVLISYKIIKGMYPIIKIGLLTYSQTSDWNETFENVIKETGRQIIKTLIGMFTNFVYGTITNIKVKNNLGLNIIG